MSDLAVDEQLFLLSRDPGSGRDRSSARTLVPRPDRRAAGRRAKEFLREAPVGGAVSDVVAAAQQAVVAAIAASVAASSSSGGGGGDGGGGGGGGV